MSNLKFEGDLDDINEAQQNYIRCVLEERGYINEKVVFQTVVQPGHHYAVSVKRIIVEKDGGTFRMVAKIAQSVQRKHIFISDTAKIFHNEHYMYARVLPKITEMMKAAGVPEDKRLRYATWYGTFMETPNEVILLEDLKISNFEMLDTFKPLSSETVKLVLNNLAILHSASFALKQQEPEIYEEFDSNLPSLWLTWCASEDMKMLMRKFEENFLMILDSEKYKKLLRGTTSQIVDHLKENAYIDKKSRFSVIQHGDAVIKNIMFRNEGDKEFECCMIDYQASKTGTPVGDIHFLIFNCTDNETRYQHFHEWMDYYHSELDNYLANFGLNATYVYPRDQLANDMRRYAKLSLGIAAFLSSMKIRGTVEYAITNEDTFDVMIEKLKISGMNEQSILRFKNTIESIMDSFLELGLLDIM